jgi:hypothetical protein
MQRDGANVRRSAVAFVLVLLVSGWATAHGQSTSSSAANQQPVGEQEQIQRSREIGDKARSNDTQTPVAKVATPLPTADKKNDNQSNGKWRVRLGTVTLGAAYIHYPDSFFFGPFYPYGIYPYAYPHGLAYSSFFYDPLYAPFYSPIWSGFAYSAGKGEVKLAAEPKTAEVYLDGAYAGLAGGLKSMWLEPGAHDLIVTNSEGATFQRRIYVLSGKSLSIKAKLVPRNIQENAQKMEKQP